LHNNKNVVAADNWILFADFHQKIAFIFSFVYWPRFQPPFYFTSLVCLKMAAFFARQSKSQIKWMQFLLFTFIIPVISYALAILLPSSRRLHHV